MVRSLFGVLSLSVLSLASPVPATSGNIEERNTPLNDFLTLVLQNVPILDGTLDEVGEILSDFEADIASITGDQITYNDLTGPCMDYTVIFARGTTEPGNVGILTGPPFLTALSTTLSGKTIAIQGVNNYPASIPDYFAGGSITGTADMATSITTAAKNCPNTKIVVSGYSQGGQLVHNSIAMLPANVASSINSVVIFGDPEEGKPIPNVAASKVLIICHLTDNICTDGDIVLVSHLDYSDSALAAAIFVSTV